MVPSLRRDAACEMDAVLQTPEPVATSHPRKSLSWARWKTHHEERKPLDVSPAAITLALLLTDEETPVMWRKWRMHHPRRPLRQYEVFGVVIADSQEDITWRSRALLADHSVASCC
jgi:hypothetical protein